MSTGEDDAARVDESHWGLQKLYFACFTERAVPLEELEPHVEEHKLYLVGLENQGRLVAAGPLLNEEYAFDGTGLIVLRAESRSEAHALADADPFHARGLRTYRIVPWQLNEGALTVRLTFSDAGFTLE